MTLVNKSSGIHATGRGDSIQQPGYEVAATKIAEFITSSGLKSGDRLPTERSLGEQLGVSRTVVREAIKLLTAVGIVRTHQGSGLYVTGEPHPFVNTAINLCMSVEPEDVLSLFEFRLTLELTTARLAAERITPKELRVLREAVELNKQSAETRQLKQFHESDAAFHRGLAEAARNSFLASAVATVFRLQDWAITIVVKGPPGSLLVAAEEHAAIFSAIYNGRPDEAAQAMRTHLETVITSYQHEVRRRLIGDMGEAGDVAVPPGE